MPLDQGRFRQIPRKAPKQPGFTNAPHSPGRTADFPRDAPPSIWQQSLRQCYPPSREDGEAEGMGNGRAVR